MVSLLISHRGNIIGPNPIRENTPSYIDTAICAGYDVEIDVKYINNKFYLGHDTPDYEITENWLEKRKNKLWIHCKNLEAANRLSELDDLNNDKNIFQYFCHSIDTFVLTSTKHIWVHDLSMNLNNKTIIPLLSLEDINKYNNKLVYAICTDYISYSEFNLKQKGLYK